MSPSDVRDADAGVASLGMDLRIYLPCRRQGQSMLAAHRDHDYRGGSWRGSEDRVRTGERMTTRGIITMTLVLLFVWGGFALFVATAVRKERGKKGGGT